MRPQQRSVRVPSGCSDHGHAQVVGLAGCGLAVGVQPMDAEGQRVAPTRTARPAQLTVFETDLPVRPVQQSVGDAPAPCDNRFGSPQLVDPLQRVSRVIGTCDVDPERLDRSQSSVDT